MNKIKIIFLLPIFSINICLGQNKVEPLFENETLNRILYYDENSRSHLFYLTYGYGYAPKNKTFSTGGTQFGIGLNISRLFTDKFFLGITYSFEGSLSKFFKQKLSNQFVSDFNSEMINSQLNIEDSANAKTLSGGINSTENYIIDGYGYSLLGVTFSPYPDRYGGLALSLFFGSSTYIFHGYQNIIPSSHSNLQEFNQKLVRMELNCKPYFFFKKGKLHPFNFDLKNLYKLATLSLYFEKLSMNDSEFGGSPLTKFVNQPFIDKYKTDYHFGIKLGIGLY